jgi:hypothetical protein
MKPINWIIVTLMLFISSAALVSSCTTNPCADIACRNFGTCREGACACTAGFEGPFCESKVTDKYIGYWDGYVRYNGDQPTNVSLIIQPGKNGTEMILYNLFTVNVPITAVSTAPTTFDVPYQQAGFSGNFVRGQGYVEQNKYIHFLYEITDTFGVFNRAYFEGTKRIVP